MAAARQDDPATEQGEAVPVPVAARRLGRSPDAIRSAIKRGKLSARLGNDGRWLVFLPAGTAAPDPVAPDSLQPVVDRLRDQLEETLRQLADRETAVADLRERVSRLEGEAAGHAVVVTELREALAWQRRPWWQRILG
jgi:hypothetical protein